MVMVVNLFTNQDIAFPNTSFLSIMLYIHTSYICTTYGSWVAHQDSPAWLFCFLYQFDWSPLRTDLCANISYPRDKLPTQMNHLLLATVYCQHVLELSSTPRCTSDLHLITEGRRLSCIFIWTSLDFSLWLALLSLFGDQRKARIGH